MGCADPLLVQNTNRLRNTQFSLWLPLVAAFVVRENTTAEGIVCTIAQRRVFFSICLFGKKRFFCSVYEILKYEPKLRN